VAQAEATRNGCDQVVWLDAAEHSWVEEMGGMNLFFVYGSGPEARIMTPTLTGTLLQGITRDSLLKLGPDLGIPAAEGRISVRQWQDGCASGEVTEVFACGTAAVITPVGQVKAAGREWQIGDGKPGPVTMRLREELLDIQYGRRADPYGWIHQLGSREPRRPARWPPRPPPGPGSGRPPGRACWPGRTRTARPAAPRPAGWAR